MSIPVQVKDYFGRWIEEGMYVNEIFEPQRRQGWVTEVDSQGKIKVKIVRENGRILDEESFYTTEFEQSTNWVKALVDG